MNDMTQVIVPKSDQWNADDFIAGPRTFTIAGVSIRSGQEQPVSIAVQGSDKVFRPCKSMSRLLVAAWGPDASKYVGRSLTLYRDPKVKWAGMEVGGIRISHMTHIDEPMNMMLTATKGSRKPHRVEPLKVAAQGNDDARAKAETWAREHIDAIKAATGDELARIIAKGEAGRKRLATAHPDLFAEVELAIGEANDDPFTGPSDEQRGEPADIPAALAAIAAADTPEAVNEAYDAVWSQASDEDAEALIKARNARLAELAA